MSKGIKQEFPKVEKTEVVAKATPAFLSSRNFWIGIISIIMGLTATNGIDFGILPEELVDKLAGKNTIELAIFIGMNFLNPVIKLIKKIQTDTWSWDFLLSENFQTQMLSILAVVIGFYMDKVEVGFVIAILVNLWNIFKKRIVKPNLV